MGANDKKKPEVSPNFKARSSGFSLVEMLVVIAVIGVISAMIIPNFGHINRSAKDTANRRNAQSIASVFASAQSAGLDFSKNLTEKEDIIAAVIAGGTVTEGTLAGTVFSIPVNAEIQTNGAEGAAKYLSWNSDKGLLLYNFDGE